MVKRKKAKHTTTKKKKNQFTKTARKEDKNKACTEQPESN